jgi:hypothetical protein
LTCSDTCRKRRLRGHDLAYLADLPAEEGKRHRFVHDAHLDAGAVARSVTDARRELRQVPLRSVTFSSAPSKKRRGGGGFIDQG